MTLAPSAPLDREPGGQRPGDGWRWETRRRLAALRDLLVAESTVPYDGWLAARSGRVARERALLLRRVGDLGALVNDQPQPVVSAELRRLTDAVERHRQRTRDLLWDEVELELGGSD